ncbi:S8 family serine peptidase [Longitalea arenae]|uniref:S8 family serine peptidase n=1 Tax=Longitalea arenae TaxID=2812558 RepID=UPI0019689559|nr:S8 family serine peptidase [Longitalea arenae]
MPNKKLNRSKPSSKKASPKKVNEASKRSTATKGDIQGGAEGKKAGAKAGKIKKANVHKEEAVEVVLNKDLKTGTNVVVEKKAMNVTVVTNRMTQALNISPDIGISIDEPLSGLGANKELQEKLLTFIKDNQYTKTKVAALSSEAIPQWLGGVQGERKLSGLPRFTGHKLVVLNPESSTRSQTKTASRSSIRMANIRDFTTDKNFNLEAALDQADGLIYDKLNVAIVGGQSQDKLGKLMATTDGANKFLSTEPERFIYSLSGATTKIADDANATWGIHATNVGGAPHSGKGVKIAVLDSGSTASHPAFKGRKIVSRSFLHDNPAADDEYGHGTMCAGIACGSTHSGYGYKYGVAHGSDLYVGRVLDSQGNGRDGDLLAAIQWAVEQGCKIISMSVGGVTNAKEKYSPAYESTASAAFREGVLLIAAAGNESDRQFGLKAPVLHPANCPSIMAVAAVDAQMEIYNGGCAGIEPGGGQIDISGPGVGIISSWLPQQYYAVDTGTSLAAPFVAGVAALYWEANPQATAADIWVKLMQTARRLPHSSADVGVGLVYYT